MVGLLPRGAKETLHTQEGQLSATYRLKRESIDFKKIGDVAFEDMGDLIEVLDIKVLFIEIKLTLRDKSRGFEVHRK